MEESEPRGFRAARAVRPDPGGRPASRPLRSGLGSGPRPPATRDDKPHYVAARRLSAGKPQPALDGSIMLLIGAGSQSGRGPEPRPEPVGRFQRLPYRPDRHREHLSQFRGRGAK